jgi:hypothetical protein
VELDEKEVELDEKEVELDEKEVELDEKEVELDEKEAELIRQVDAKEIGESWFWELVVELDLERAMGESMANRPAMTQATMQDKNVGESEQDELVGEEEPEAAAIAVESSTISKGKQKVVPAKTKVFSKVHGPISQSAKVIVNMQLTHHAHSATSVLHTRPS